MRRAAGPGLVAWVILLGVAWALAGPARAEGYRPEMSLQLGRTFAVGSRVSGAFDQGGFTVAAGLLWPWEQRFRFGAQFFGADFGHDVEKVTLADPSGGPSKDYGSIDFGHLGAWGAAWRVDALGPRLGTVGRGYLTASYGYFRNQFDRVGNAKGSVSSVGGSLGLGVERTLGPHHALGLAAGATWMSEDFTRRYGSASLEWRWRW
jgi:hypothetical protein